MLNTDRLCPGCMRDNGGEQICPLCGYDQLSKNDLVALPTKFWLSDRYMIGRVLSTNCDGITYMGWDNSENHPVNIHEYFPEGLSARNSDKTVSMTAGNEFAFNEGLMEFIDLNKKFIGTAMPSVIPVSAVFEENGSAYSVRPLFSGISLKAFLERNGGNLKWEQARPLFLSLIDTVNHLHDAGVYHGAISPETVFVGRDGKLRLTGICIIRSRVLNSGAPAEIYNGYAAPEQYGITDMGIGTYTDVYGLAATLLRVLTGIIPPPANERLSNDSLSIPSKFAEELPRQVLVALANGLQINADKRTPNIETFKNELVYGETKENEQYAEARRKLEEKATVGGKKGAGEKKSSALKYALISAACTIGLFVVAFAILYPTVFKKGFFSNGDDDISNPAVISAPSVVSIGDVDSGAEVSKILHSVPDFTGTYYSQAIENEENKYFNIIIKDMQFSDKFSRGTISAQSVEAGKGVESDTDVYVTISLGSKEIAVANVVGLDKSAALIELLKQGFLYENIEVVDKYDSEAKPGIVLDQDPTHGEKVSVESSVRIYVNSYEGEVDNSSVQ